MNKQIAFRIAAIAMTTIDILGITMQTISFSQAVLFTILFAMIAGPLTSETI